MNPDPNSPQIIASLLREHEAVLLVNFLTSLGIQAEMFGANSASSWPELPENVSVAVRQKDLLPARQALHEFRQRQSITHEAEGQAD